MQSIATVYQSAHPGKPLPSLLFGPFVVKSHYGAGVIGSSHAAGYDIAEAVVMYGSEKKLALFYNKLNGPWQYVTEATDEFGFKCQDFKATEEVRKVMNDQVCLSDEGPVRLDTQNPATQ